MPNGVFSSLNYKFLGFHSRCFEYLNLLSHVKAISLEIIKCKHRGMSAPESTGYFGGENIILNSDYTSKGKHLSMFHVPT